MGAIGSLGVVGTALAHAELTSSTPANQAILASTPPEILLTFSEGVDPVGDSIRRRRRRRQPRAARPDRSVAGRRHACARPVPATIADGTYIVGWQAISADSHKIRGAFTFSVGAATPTAPGVIDAIFDASGTDQSDSLLLGIGRFMSYAGIGVLLGALFLAAVLVPELIGERRIGTLLVAAALVAIVGTGLMFAGQAHLVSGSYLAWGDVVRIQSGKWWLGRFDAIGLFALFIAGALVPGLDSSGVSRWRSLRWSCAVSSLPAGMQSPATSWWPGSLATVVHLAAMSIWLGGLALLAFGVPRSWFWWTASHFSPWALGAVVVLAANRQRERMAPARFALGAHRFVATAAGSSSSCCSWRWWWRSRPSVAAWPAPTTRTSRGSRRRADGARSATSRTIIGDGAVTNPPQEAPAALRRTVLLEVAGMALILMATAGLVNSPPPPSAATTESASAVVGDRIVQVELEPAVTEGAEMHIYLSSPSGGLDRADEITVTASLRSADLGPLDIETVPAGPNHVIGTDVESAGRRPVDIRRHGPVRRVRPGRVHGPDPRLQLTSLQGTVRPGSGIDGLPIHSQCVRMGAWRRVTSIPTGRRWRVRGSVIEVV